MINIMKQIINPLFSGYPGVTLDQLTDIQSEYLKLIGHHEALFGKEIIIFNSKNCIMLL